MKKSRVISLLVALAILGIAITSFARTGVVTTDSLKLRKGPSTDTEILQVLSVNDELEILGEEEGWYKVKVKDKTGYVASQYINVLEDKNTNNIGTNEGTNNNSGENTNTETPKTEEEKKNVLVAGEKVYITPLINSLVINTLNEEKEIEVISETNRMVLYKNRNN